MLNNISTKLMLAALIIAASSCSTNNKNVEIVKNDNKQNQVLEIKKLPENNKIISTSDSEIKKSSIVYFDTNSAKLNKNSIEIITKFLVEIKNNNAKEILIESHCDERGSKIYNKKLSQKRADNIKNYLIKNGVKNIKIKSIAYGSAKPLSLGHDEKSWAKNRRAVTIIVK